MWGIDGFVRLVPLRFLGVDVDIEPGVRCELEKRRYGSGCRLTIPCIGRSIAPSSYYNVSDQLCTIQTGNITPQVPWEVGGRWAA